MTLGGGCSEDPCARLGGLRLLLSAAVLLSRARARGTTCTRVVLWGAFLREGCPGREPPEAPYAARQGERRRLSSASLPGSASAPPPVRPSGARPVSKVWPSQSSPPSVGGTRGIQNGLLLRLGCVPHMSLQLATWDPRVNGLTAR